MPSSGTGIMAASARSSRAGQYWNIGPQTPALRAVLKLRSKRSLGTSVLVGRAHEHWHGWCLVPDAGICHARLVLSVALTCEELDQGMTRSACLSSTAGIASPIPFAVPTLIVR